MKKIWGQSEWKYELRIVGDDDDDENNDWNGRSSEKKSRSDNFTAVRRWRWTLMENDDGQWIWRMMDS